MNSHFDYNFVLIYKNFQNKTNGILNFTKQEKLDCTS